MEDSAREFEIVSRLKFIGRLKKGERIDVSSMNVLRPSIFTSLYRTFVHRENRQCTLHFIRDTFSSAFEAVEELEDSTRDKDKQRLRSTLADIRGAIPGIRSIQCTYSGDSKFCCDLETVEQFVTSKLAKYIKTLVE